MSINVSENEIRKEICEILHSCTDYDLKSFTHLDFEFIEVSGKCASVPSFKEGFDFDVRAVKQLAGSGCLYVRLTKKVEDQVVIIDNVSDDEDSSSDSSLPSFSSVLKGPSSTPLQGTSSTPLQGSSSTPLQGSSSTPLQGSSSTPLQGSSSTPLQGSSSTPLQTTPLSSFQNQTDLSPLSKPYSTSLISRKEIIDIFPNLSSKQIDYVYEISENSDTVLNCLVSSETLLQQVAAQYITIPLEESPKILLDADDDEKDWTEAAISFYKGTHFNPNGHVKICIRGQPAVDTGGVRRQFFAVVFDCIAHSFGIFEGDSNYLRPAFRATSFSSGILTILGMMIGHSILLDGQGFPSFLNIVTIIYVALLIKL